MARSVPEKKVMPATKRRKSRLPVATERQTLSKSLMGAGARFSPDQLAVADLVCERQENPA